MRNNSIILHFNKLLRASADSGATIYLLLQGNKNELWSGGVSLRASVFHEMER